MYKIIRTLVDGVECFIVYNMIKRTEEIRFSTNKEAMSYIKGR
jgi:hypothetical protein